MNQPHEPAPEHDQHWRRNLLICLLGSFTTIVAMTLLLPFLPLYVAQLGAHGRAAIAQWSGIAYGATFFAAALVAPLWGRLGDRYGRKPMLVRASLGMAIAMSLIGMAHSIGQLVALRLFAGLAGGYASGSTILVATQTPRAQSGWALGMLSSGIMAGNLAGPLIGGILPPLIGIRATFWLAGGLIFCTFLATTCLLREDKRPETASITASAEGRPAEDRPAEDRPAEGWSAIANKRAVIAMLVTGALLMLANMSIEPIITLYVAQFVSAAHVTLVAGIAMSAAALGSILSAARFGRLGDRIGHRRVIGAALAGAAILLVPQAYVTTGWELVALRFLMGVALGGLLPCITSVIRHNVPQGSVGRILGYATSSQFAGQVLGPLLGGFVGGHSGLRAVFLGTSLLMAVGAGMAWASK